MSQIGRTALAYLLVSFLLLVLSGCGDTRSPVSFDPRTGSHPAGWLPSGHRVAAAADMDDCATCHGADFRGGIAKTACTSCHLGNQNSYHPTQWGNFAYALHGAYAKTNGTASCANTSCHGTALKGVTGVSPSCTSCHIGGVDLPHPAQWTANLALHSNYVALNGTTSCANGACHGSSLTGVFNSGPSCTSCHIGGIGSIHPPEWSADFRLHKGYVAANGAASCANAVCHGTDLLGVPNGGLRCDNCHSYVPGMLGY